MANTDNSGRNTRIYPHRMHEHYDLVSGLYHTLQAVGNVPQYEQDPPSEGSPDIADFMPDVQKQNEQIAQRERELLFKNTQI